MKTAFITGITGQDGAYLAKLLLEKGYKVFGGRRRNASDSNARLRTLGIEDDIEFIPFELVDKYNIDMAVKKIKPDELYNLAAMSYVGDSFSLTDSVYEMDFIGVINLLGAITVHSPSTRFYQASSSEMFGLVNEDIQSETTPFRPRSKYGIAKLASHWATVHSREADNLYSVSGICFNHESPLRGKEFVTKKITNYVTLSKYDKPLELGNLYSKRDWGHAKDYVRAMHMMLEADIPNDYVIATGQVHSVKEFVDEVFLIHNGQKLEWVGSGVDEKGYLNGRLVVEINPKFYRPSEVNLLCGDSSLIRETLGWNPEYDITGLITDMLATTYF